MKRLLVTVFLSCGVVRPVVAQSNIDDTEKFAWCENVGWTNWRDADEGINGVIVRPDHLAGFVWGENIGWVNVGNGEGPYANTDDGNFGVNILADGDLEGFSWGENVGWINFNSSGQSPNQARFDFAANRFRGYAWGENIGWINLDDGTHFVAAIPPIIDVPEADPSGIGEVRYISFVVPAPNAGPIETALQVRHISLMHPDPPNLPQFPPPNFAAQEGTVRYVGAPSICQETESPPTTFKCATLQCAPIYMDWEAALGGQTLHVTGQAVVPSSTYELRQLAASCQGNEATCSAISAPLTIKTQRWGDVAAAFQAPSPAPLTQPNISDVAACVDKFKGVPTAIIVARADVNPAVPNGRVDIADVANIVDAFKNLAYPFSGPAACP